MAANRIYDTYMKGMYHRKIPVDQDNTPQQRLSGLATFEVIHERIVIPLTTKQLTSLFLDHSMKCKTHNLTASDHRGLRPVFQTPKAISQKLRRVMFCLHQPYRELIVSFYQVIF